MSATPAMVRALLPADLTTSDSGVYLLVKDDRVVYVGQATVIAKRAGQHVLKHEPDYVVYIPCDVDEMDVIESRWIHFLRPPGNGTHKSGRKNAPLPVAGGLGCYPNARDSVWESLDAQALAAADQKPRATSKRAPKKTPRWASLLKPAPKYSRIEWWGTFHKTVDDIVADAISMCDGLPFEVWTLEVPGRPVDWGWDNYGDAVFLDGRAWDALHTSGDWLSELPAAIKGQRQTADYLVSAATGEAAWLIWAAALFESGRNGHRRSGATARWPDHFRKTSPITYHEIVDAVHSRARGFAWFRGWDSMVTDLVPEEIDEDPPNTYSASSLACALAEDWTNAAAQARGNGYRLLRLDYDKDAHREAGFAATRAAMERVWAARRAAV